MKSPTSSEWFNQVDAQYKSELRDLADRYFARFEARMEQFRAELIKWMFLFWIGSVATMGGLMFAAVSLARR